MAFDEEAFSNRIFLTRFRRLIMRLIGKQKKISFVTEIKNVELVKGDG